MADQLDELIKANLEYHSELFIVANHSHISVEN